MGRIVQVPIEVLDEYFMMHYSDKYNYYHKTFYISRVKIAEKLGISEGSLNRKFQVLSDLRYLSYLNKNTPYRYTESKRQLDYLQNHTYPTRWTEEYIQYLLRVEKRGWI